MAENLQFEKAMEKLEGIVEKLESGDVSLEEALKKYEEGVRLARSCQKNLAEAEKKIEVLTRSLSGSFETEDYDPTSEEEKGAQTKQKKKKRATKANQDEEGFLI